MAAIDDLEIHGRVRRSLVKLGVIEDVYEGVQGRFYGGVKFATEIKSQKKFTQKLARMMRESKPLMIDLRCTDGTFFNLVTSSKGITVTELVDEIPGIEKLISFIKCGTTEYCMKTSHMSVVECSDKVFRTILENEKNNYLTISKSEFNDLFPKVVAHGRLWYSDSSVSLTWEVLIMEKMMKSLFSYYSTLKVFEVDSLIKAVKVLKQLHDESYVHGDSKLDNFLFADSQKRVVKLVDPEVLMNVKSLPSDMAKLRKLVDLNKLIFSTPPIYGYRKSITDNALERLRVRVTSIKDTISASSKDQFIFDRMLLPRDEWVDRVWSMGNNSFFFKEAGSVRKQIEGLDMDQIYDIMSSPELLFKVISFIQNQLGKIIMRNSDITPDDQVLISVPLQSSQKQSSIPKVITVRPQDPSPPYETLTRPKVNDFDVKKHSKDIKYYTMDSDDIHQFNPAPETEYLPGPYPSSTKRGTGMYSNPQSQQGQQSNPQQYQVPPPPPQQYQAPQPQPQQYQAPQHHYSQHHPTQWGAPAPPASQIQIPYGIILTGTQYPPDQNFSLNPLQQIQVYGSVLYYAEEMNLFYRGQPYRFALAVQPNNMVFQENGVWIYYAQITKINNQTVMIFYNPVTSMFTNGETGRASLDLFAIL